MADTKKTTTSKKSVFDTLMAVNVNDRKQKKGKFDYLSWAYAWAEVKKRYPDATSKVYENHDGFAYHTDGRTAWVKVGVTIKEQEHIEYLAIMDNYNNAMPLEKITARNVCDSIQRAMVKAIARHGLGLYIYAGEDIPAETPEEVAERKMEDLGDAEIPSAEQFIQDVKNASNPKITKIRGIAERIGQPLENICKTYKVKAIEDLTPQQADEVLDKLKEAKK